MLSKLSVEKNSTKAVEVECITLKNVIDTNGYADYALVSDIEGAEEFFIMGNEEGLRKCKLLIIELHDTDNLSVIDMVKVLEEKHGFNKIDYYGDVYVFNRL